MSAATERMDDRRATAVAVGLVAGVVAVLGFGSGLWSEVAERTGSAASGRDLGTVVQGGGVVDVGVTPGPASAGALGARRISAVSPTGEVAPATTAPHATHTAVPAEAPTEITAGPAVVPTACSTGAVAPFWTHFEAAHLETSPGQQAADALDLDRYVQTHTVLIEAMLTPVVDAVLGGPGKPGAFWTHFQKAHLETSPGQQVADALDLDRYVQTHTVLIEDILDPIVGTC